MIVVIVGMGLPAVKNVVWPRPGDKEMPRCCVLLCHLQGIVSVGLMRCKLHHLLSLGRTLTLLYSQELRTHPLV